MEAWGRGEEIEISPNIDGRKVESAIFPRREKDIVGRARIGSISLDKNEWPIGTKVFFSVVAHAIDDVTGEMRMSEPSNMVVALVPEIELASCDADGCKSDV